MSKSTKRQFKSDRKSIREVILPAEIRGFVQIAGSESHYPCVVWDVTPEGLGVWLPSSLELETSVTIILKIPSKQKIPAVVRWCDATTETGGGFRAGLEVDPKNETLIYLCQEYIK